MKVIMYLSTVVLLCWLAGHYYGSSARDRIVPSSTGGGGGAGGNNANGAGNDSYSERGNSADISTRSQPPTRRTSRTNSLIEAMSNASADGGGSANNNNNNKAPVPLQSSGASESRKPQQQGSANRSVLHSGNEPTGPKAAAAAATDFSSAAANQMTARASLTTQPPPDVSLSGSAASNPTPLGREQSRTKRTIARSSRIFSKVDDEWNSRSFNDQLAMQQQQQQQNEQRDANQAEVENKPAQQGDLDRLISSSEPLSSSNLEPDAKSEQAQMVDASKPNGELQNDRRKRKGWFMQVYCNFVRMLTGIRGSLSEAGQLNVVENDFRDKQLEMLAGKIDNWYNTNASAVLPATQLAAKSSSTDEDAQANDELTSGTNRKQQLLATSDLQTASALEQVKSTQEAPSDDGVRVQFDAEKLDSDKLIVKTNDERNEASSALMQTDLEHSKQELEVKQATVSPAVQDSVEKPTSQTVDESKNLGLRKLERSEHAVKDGELAEDKAAKKTDQVSVVMEAPSDKVTGQTNQLEVHNLDGGGDTTMLAQAKQIEKEKVLESGQHDDNLKSHSSESVESKQSNNEIDTDDSKNKKEKNNNNNIADSISGGGKNDNNSNMKEKDDNNNDSYITTTDNDSGNNNIRISDNHYIARKDSDQSNQTIINKSDTSGDESVASSVISNDNRDKIAAFERMEMALVAKS